MVNVLSCHVENNQIFPEAATGNFGYRISTYMMATSHHFLCNYRLTLHHVEFKTFRMRSIGWVLFGANFRPLQEIKAIMGGGQIFDSGPFFARLQ